VEDLGCLVHMPGPVGESWKLYLELAADYGRMTGNPSITRLGKVCRQHARNRAGRNKLRYRLVEEFSSVLS
jgi:hypothetical protein